MMQYTRVNDSDMVHTLQLYTINNVLLTSGMWLHALITSMVSSHLRGFA